MARLDRMEGEREVAQLAAVLGREFSYELLAAVASVDEPTLQAELAKLVQAEILYPKGRPPRCTYIFKHALLEDALYNALVKGKRQQFHRRIAEVLEARFPQTARDAAGAARPPLHRGGPDREGDRLLAQGGAAVAGAVGGLRSDRPLDQRPGAAGDARGVARARRAGIAVPHHAGPRLHRGPRLRRARSRADPAPGPRTVPADRGSAPAVRDHAGHVGVAPRARRPAAVRRPGRRGDGARRASERPRHADGSAVHAGRHDVLPGPFRGRPRLLREGGGRLRRPRAHEVLGRLYRATTPA